MATAENMIRLPGRLSSLCSLDSRCLTTPHRLAAHYLKYLSGPPRLRDVLLLPSAGGTNTTAFPGGESRNLAFAIPCGGVNPLSFTFGLVLGVMVIQVSSWNMSFYHFRAINLVVSILASFNLPKFPRSLVVQYVPGAFVVCLVLGLRNAAKVGEK